MNVILLVARGLQAGYLGCYGQMLGMTPATNALAAEGVVFDQHFSDGTDVTASWSTGLYQPASLHLREGRLAEFLASGGVTSLCLVSSAGPPSAPPLAKWDHVEYHTLAADPADSGSIERGLKRCLKRLPDDRPFFLCLDLGQFLLPWQVPAEFLELFFPPKQEVEGPGDPEADEPLPLEPLLDPSWIEEVDDEVRLRLRDTGLAAAAWLDDQVRVVVELLMKRKLLDSSLLVLTSDQGQPLGEHGVVGSPSRRPYEEAVHLPLVLRLPGEPRPGRRIAEITQPLDLFPTLLDALQIPGPERHGQSLLRLAEGAASSTREYAIAEWDVGGQKTGFLRSHEWAYLPTAPEAGGEADASLFRKPEDRWDMNDIGGQQEDLKLRLEGLLEEVRRQCREPGPLHLPPWPRPEDSEEEEQEASVQD